MDDIRKKLKRILEETGYFISEEKWRKEPRKNCLGKMLGIDLWINVCYETKQLRTLKDLQKDYEWKFDTYWALRQEAIKWIEQIQFRFQYDGMVAADGGQLTSEGLKESRLYFGSEYSPEDRLNGRKQSSPIAWIMHFFDISEDDLK